MKMFEVEENDGKPMDQAAGHLQKLAEEETLNWGWTILCLVFLVGLTATVLYMTLKEIILK